MTIAALFLYSILKQKHQSCIASSPFPCVKPPPGSGFLSASLMVLSKDQSVQFTEGTTRTHVACGCCSSAQHWLPHPYPGEWYLGYDCGCLAGYNYKEKKIGFFKELVLMTFLNLKITVNYRRHFRGKEWEDTRMLISLRCKLHDLTGKRGNIQSHKENLKVLTSTPHPRSSTEGHLHSLCPHSQKAMFSRRYPPTHTHTIRYIWTRHKHTVHRMISWHIHQPSRFIGKQTNTGLEIDL